MLPFEVIGKKRFGHSTLVKIWILFGISPLLCLIELGLSKGKRIRVIVKLKVKFSGQNHKKTKVL